jgi:hypothetical protein
MCFINDDWEIIERVIDFKPLDDKEHAGLYGGKAFVDGASKIGSVDKISLPCDFGCENCLPLYTASVSPPTMLPSMMFLYRPSLAFFWLNTGYLLHPTYKFTVCATL